MCVYVLMRTPAYIRKVKKCSKCGGITVSYSENPGTGWGWVWRHLVFNNGSLICNVTQSLEGNIFLSYAVGEAKSKTCLDFLPHGGTQRFGMK